MNPLSAQSNHLSRTANPNVPAGLRHASPFEATVSVGSGLVDAQVVADYLGVTRGWVYEHAAELQARRLGAGPKGRLRFSLEDVDRAVSCSATRESEAVSGGVVEPSRRRRRTSVMPSVPDLLPIRGQSRRAAA